MPLDFSRERRTNTAVKLFDFFFPEEAQAAHLRRIADNQSFAERRQSYEERARARRHAEIDERFASIERELEFHTLMLEAIVRKADEKGLVTREELKTLMKAIDLEDGRADGKMSG